MQFDPSSEAAKTVTFGVFELDLELSELRRNGRSIRIQPQAFRLLTALTERPGEVLSRENLCKTIWGQGVYVDFQSGLNVCVRQARAALSDDAEAPLYIETVPRLGYRFIAPVRVTRKIVADPVVIDKISIATKVDIGSPKENHRSPRMLSWGLALLLLLSAVAVLLMAYNRKPHLPSVVTAVSASSPRRVRLIVLPFRNLSGRSSLEYVADGMTEELISQLSSISPEHFSVISIVSSMSYKSGVHSLAEISRETGVQYVLEGSIRSRTHGLRITVGLIQASDQSTLWSHSYDVQIPQDDLTQSENDVAYRCSRFFQLQILRENRMPTVVPAAYDAYLRGRYLLNQRTKTSLQSAIKEFKTAQTLQADFAPAYVEMAKAYLLQIDYFDAVDGKQATLAQQAIKHALELDSNLADAHISQAFLSWRVFLDPGAAEREFQKALRLDPNNAQAHHWYGLFLNTERRFDEAERQLQLARESDPVSLIVLTNLGWLHYFRGDMDGAIRQYRQVLQLNPNFATAWVKLAWALEAKGEFQEAAEARIRSAETLGCPESMITQYRRILNQKGYRDFYTTFLNGHESIFDRARMLAVLGRHDQAEVEIRRMRSTHNSWIPYLVIDPVLKQDAFVSEAIADRAKGPVVPAS